MGMLLHNTLMEQERLRREEMEKQEKTPAPEANEPEAEPVKKPTGRRKTSK